MKKVMQCLMLGLVLLCSCGWKWSKVYNNNKDIIDNSQGCSYENYGQNNKYPVGIKTFDFKFSSDTYSIKINGGYGFNINYGNNFFPYNASNDIKNPHNSNNNKYNIELPSQNFFDEYFNNYKNSTCPNIFLCIDNVGNNLAYFLNTPDTENQDDISNGVGVSCYEYKVIKANTTGGCLLDNAKSCFQHHNQALLNNRTVGIEVGLTNDDKEYFLISYDDFKSQSGFAFKNGTVNSNDGNIMDTFRIGNSNSAIFRPDNNGKYPGITIEHEKDSLTGNENIYWIYNESDTNKTHSTPTTPTQPQKPTKQPNNGGKLEDNFCAKTAPIWQFIGYGVFVLKILIPIIIIILGTVDLAKAIISSDDKAINKAIMTLVQRVIVGVLIFFVPTIMRLVSGLVSGFVDENLKSGYCVSCLTNPHKAVCKRGVKKAKEKIKEG